ncbi:MAG: helix-turn-helix domain-containing protein [Xanthobacteraceae bacterium]
MPRAPARTAPLLDDPVETVNEVAAYTKRHPKTICKLIREGKGPAVVRLTEHRIGIRRSAKEAWLARCSVEPKERAADE